jgi:glycosyltransferase involved in cell wall biosynthesis
MAEAPIRVLHLRDSPWVDGPGRTILETGAHLDPSRVAYFIGAFVAKEGEHPLVESARARGINVIPLRDEGGFAPHLVNEIVELIDKHRINVLHVSEFRSSLIAQLVRRRRRVRMVATAHGWIANTPRRRFIRLLDKLLLRRYDRVILVSDAMRRLVPRWWLPDGRVQVLRNALVLKSYGKSILERPRRTVETAKEVVLVNIGRLSPEKGQDMLIRAVHALSARWPALRLRFAGIGPLEASLKELAATLGIADRVEFIGYVADMPSLYADIDLVVQSSYTEGLPNVILEAAYLRVPIVATAVGGTAEVVEHQRTAWLIEPKLEQLIDGIERFLNDPALFARMAELAHHDILANYSFDVRTERLTALYENLLAEST